MEESFRLEKSFQIFASTTKPCPSARYLYGFWIPPGMVVQLLLGQSVPGFENPIHEEDFLNIQYKSTLVKLEVISSSPVTCYPAQEINPYGATTSFQGQAESDKVSSQPPFIQSKHPQLPQLLPEKVLLQTLHQLSPFTFLFLKAFYWFPCFRCLQKNYSWSCRKNIRCFFANGQSGWSGSMSREITFSYS